MRWSLSVFAFFLASIYLEGALSLPTPSNRGDGLLARQELFRRTGKSVKNSVYRKNSRDHPYEYSSGAPLPASGQHTVKKSDDADHILEAQTVHKALNDAGIPLNTLPPAAVDDIKKKFNGPDNVVPIDASINRSKGQVTKLALDGKVPTTMKPGVLDYGKATHPVAQDNAEGIDDILHAHGVTKAGTNIVADMNKKVAKQAGFIRRR